MADDRVLKLPAWAQDYIRKMEQDFAGLEKEYEALRSTVEAGPEDSTVFAEIDDTTRPLGRDVDITFKVGEEEYTVRLLENGGISVNASKDLTIEPSAPYEVFLRMKKEWT